MKNIKKIIGVFIWKIGSVFHHFSKYVYTPKEEERVKSWFQINGDRTLRLNYDLNHSSVVFDIGGYEGQWTSDIFSKYLCTIYIFEPVNSFFQEIKNRFNKNEKIHCYNQGASNSNYVTEINLGANSSSVFKKGQGKEKIEMIDLADFLKKNNIEKVDLLKINIEGGEYDLLEHLINTDFVKKITNIQVQFHDFVPRAKERMTKIQERLSITHSPTYQYEFVWENWLLKK